MPPDNTPSSEHPDSPPSNNVPPIEDAYTPDVPPEEAVGEDDPQLLDPASRSLEAGTVQAGDVAEDSPTSPSGAAASAEKDDMSDTATIPDELATPATTAQEPELPDWSNEMSAHKIVVELKRIESEIRRLLEGRDTKRKRKLAGTRRWLELQEDIITWRYSSRIDEPTLRHLQELVAKRHHLFGRLCFIAGTRPTWNT
ncbi:MAG: hypothetical protein WBE26_07225 [Phycisphaerae bacterium]